MATASIRGDVSVIGEVGRFVQPLVAQHLRKGQQIQARSPSSALLPYLVGRVPLLK